MSKWYVTSVHALVIGISATFAHAQEQPPGAADLAPKPAATTPNGAAAATPAAPATGPSGAPVSDASTPLASDAGGDLDKVIQTLSDKVYLHKFPSGLGMVSVGTAPYGRVKNPTATQIKRREALQNAYAAARQNIAKYLQGSDVEVERSLKSVARTATTAEEDLNNTLQESRESARQFLRARLKAVVIYSQSDKLNEQDNVGEVRVALVSSPKTISAISQVVPTAIDVSSLEQGLRYVEKELRSGVTAITGSRIVSIKGSDNVALVGFGSAVQPSSPDAEQRAILGSAAKQQATRLANGALVELMKGSEESWSGAGKQGVQQSTEFFDEDERAGEITRLRSARKKFLAQMETSRDYQSVQRGTVPPGVTPVTWIDDKGGFAYAMVIYHPGSEGLARQMKEQMDSAGQPGGKVDPSAGFIKSGGQPAVPARTDAPLPSGNVSKKDDL